MNIISHACIVYRDDTKRFFTVACNEIKLKRNSKCSITPKNDTDFDKKYVYYAKWENCDEKCKEDCDKHVGYHSAFILLLGESEEDIERRKAGHRLSIPIVKDSSESEEFQPVPKKLKHSNSIKDAQSKKNGDVLSKYNTRLMLASRTRLNKLDFDGDEDTENMNVNKEVGNENEQNNDDRRLKQQPQSQMKISKDKEIQELQAKLIKLQEALDQSHQSPTKKATGNMKADVDAVKRNLFQEAVDETKEPSGIQSEEYSGGSSTVIGPKPRLAVKSIEKLNTNINIKMKSERSKPISGDQGMEKKCGNVKDRVTTSATTLRKVSGSMEQTCNMNDEKSVESLVQGFEQNLHEERLESVESDHETIQDAEDDGHVIDRLEPKIKHRKSADLGNERVNKKLVKEIETSLRHYELGVDGSGRKLYEVTDKRIYLGEGINMSVTAWHLIYHKKATIFLNDIILLLWGDRTLMNRCQNIAKVTTKLADRSPIKELTPTKKRLLYKLYYDHLDEKKVSLSDRMKLLKKIPETLTTKINNIRKKYYR